MRAGVVRELRQLVAGVDDLDALQELLEVVSRPECSKVWLSSELFDFTEAALSASRWSGRVKILRVGEANGSTA